jgi:hypothetical protein
VKAGAYSEAANYFDAAGRGLLLLLAGFFFATGAATSTGTVPGAGVQQSLCLGMPTELK